MNGYLLFAILDKNYMYLGTADSPMGMMGGKRKKVELSKIPSSSPISSRALYQLFRICLA